MKVIQSLKDIEIQGAQEGISLTLGNFDGVHQGHAWLIREQLKLSSEKNLVFCVISFRPHPRFILSSPDQGFLLTSYEKKKQLLSKLGVPYFWELGFDREMSTLGPEEFAHRYLLSDKRVKAIYVGHDFFFGANKSGNLATLKKLTTGRELELKSWPQYHQNGYPVSSSLIRETLARGEIELVNQFLGRPYAVDGRVIKGQGRGRKIGFPTANLDFSKKVCLPKTGVYVGETKTGDLLYHSVTNVGQNPTFTEEKKINVETHLLDFDRDIYGESIEVTLLKRLRDEQKFQSANALIDQIQKDVQAARKAHS